MFNLDEVVREWAWKEYAATATAKQRRLLNKQQQKKNKYIDLQIDWSSVRFIDETKWMRDANANGTLESAIKLEGRQMETGRIDPPEPTTSVLFETKFVNDTDVPQKYTMRTEKTTRSSISTSIEKGLTKGFEMGVKLMTPCEVFEASAGYRREVTLSNSEGETFEEELTWSVESEIQVKENEAVEASLVVNERKQTGKFVVKTKISGMVYVTFTNIKDNNSFLKSTGNDISEIVKEHIDRERKRERDLPFVKISGTVVLVETVGECKFRYGVSQEVKVNKRPITLDEKAANDRDGAS